MRVVAASRPHAAAAALHAVLTVAAEPCLTPPPSLQVKRVFCESSGALVPKDKAVKRFIVRNIVESAALRDLQESCVYDCKCPTRRDAAARWHKTALGRCNRPTGTWARCRTAILRVAQRLKQRPTLEAC